MYKIVKEKKVDNFEEFQKKKLLRKNKLKLGGVKHGN